MFFTGRLKHFRKYNLYLIAFVASTLSVPALALDAPINLREIDDVLHWDSNAPSFNIYEDGMYIATVHDANNFEILFSNSVYQVVAHDHGVDFSALSDVFVFIDDQDGEDEPGDEEELSFEESELYFELNNTDGDLGIHSLVDGDAWTNLVYEDMNGRKLIEIELTGSMAEQGLTELFFESSEPTFDELAPVEFFARFPAGTYDIEGVTTEGQAIEGEAVLSQVLPAAPVVFIGNGAMSAADGCEDDPANDINVFLDSNGRLPIIWDPVTSSHPELGVAGNIEVALYQFVLEGENFNFTADLDSDTTNFSVPVELINSGDEIKIELIVRDSTHNQVATEACANVI